MLRKTNDYYEKKSYTPQLRGRLSNWTAVDIKKVVQNTEIYTDQISQKGPYDIIDGNIESGQLTDKEENKENE